MANHLVARLAVMYGKPDTDDPKAWFDEMDNLVKNYSRSELDKAADIVLRTHRGNRFPSVSELLTACADAREMGIDHKPTPPKYPEWTPEAIAKADELIRSGLGKRAAEEGWVFALHTFCRKHRRLPMDREIGACIAEAKAFDEAYARNSIEKEKGSRLHAALNDLGDSMLRMRAFLGEVVHGRVRSDAELRAYLNDPKSFQVRGRAA
ncbi:hypothetical protein [Hyphomicrobium sp. ghe19]|uniref:hypothetical protein n=1 Tax=Hyphomicrobium sp. ghe19 TaxID=2682968 RepID=UPI0013674DAC|nr:hypothetical protein HYPP_01498 [Hyphomicrobium sp. ghe19]